MNEFDNIPFSDDNLEQTNSLSDLPFQDSVPQTNNIIILDDRIKDIPPLTKSETPIVTDNNIIILDDRINNIPAKNSRISFKKTSIIFPVLAFVFVSIIVMCLFIKNSRAESSNLIRIEQNGKVGYVDNEGTIVVKAKYSYGTEYYKGLAIVKNDNELLGVLNSKGILREPFGTFHSIALNDDNYVASKITSNGLQYALLDSKLSEKTHFEYDNITYIKDGYYSFISGETLGILDSAGDEIYTFKVDEIDDKKINVELSDVDENTEKNRYAKVKVNKSSLVVDLSTGKEVFGYTLNEIYVSNNNVFYMKPETETENNTYIVINDGKVKYKTDKYKLIKVDDINSDIAICINNDGSIEYIDLDDQSIINEEKENTFIYGSGLLLEKEGEVYKIHSSNKVLGTFDGYNLPTGIYSNNRLIVETEEGKNYIDEKGYLINEKWYEEVWDFNELGYARVKENSLYGIINKKGETIIESKYPYIDFINEKYFKELKSTIKKELFIIKDESGNFGLIDKDDNKLLETKYQNFEFISEKYPFLLATINGKKVLIDLNNMKEMDIEVFDSIKITHNSIISNNYYTYSGKMVYKVQ